MFIMTVEKLKAFLTVLLVSGYAGLPRQEMCWERRKNCHNIAASTMMIKTEFLEYKRHLHLADNSTFNSSDKSARVPPLFNAINEQCILNYQPTHLASFDEFMVPYFGKHEGKTVHTWQAHKTMGYGNSIRVVH